MQKEEADLVLIQSVLAGHIAAYARLVDRHQSYVFTLAFRFAKNREDAEEIAQDCFVKAYKALGTFKQNARFTTWLYTITYTTAMTYLRKKKLTMTSIHEEGIFMEIPNQGAQMDADQIERKSTYDSLNAAIARLSPDDAVIITLFYQAEHSLEEIGTILAMEVNTVKVRLFRARQRLKEKLLTLLKDEVRDLI